MVWGQVCSAVEVYKCIFRTTECYLTAISIEPIEHGIRTDSGQAFGSFGLQRPSAVVTTGRSSDTNMFENSDTNLQPLAASRHPSYHCTHKAQYKCTSPAAASWTVMRLGMVNAYRKVREMNYKLVGSIMI